MKTVQSNSADYSRKYFHFLASFVLFFYLLTPAYNQTVNQEKDKLKPNHKYFSDHNTTKAMWMSAALPGLGQYYNQKYWKIPIVYSGFATLAYFSILNKQEYVKYRDAYAIKKGPDGATSEDPIVKLYTDTQLLGLREYYQKNLELNYILFGAFYILQIVDATVDAHFFDYDIDDNLSLGIDPIFYQNKNRIYASPGIQLRWTFGNP